MADQQLLERITLNPNVMTGKPVIRGTRLMVHYVLNLLAHVSTEETLFFVTVDLERECIRSIISTLGVRRDSAGNVNNYCF